ncbi:MAG: hypothetical protein N838_23075 [Thiohalocapsa sp. PB-PSB1]|jgi:hypothetical protein|nr:MAG: hypothetical protein N838_23075 [Thiohalocapsa sp. PB-PSB1]
MLTRLILPTLVPRAADYNVRNSPNLHIGDLVMLKITGKWKIIEMEQWDLKFIDEQGPGYFEFKSNNQGSFMFGYVEGEIDFRESESKHSRIEYSWIGQDEMDDASGRGYFEIVNDNEIYGEIFFHQGDSSWVKATKIK